MTGNGPSGNGRLAARPRIALIGGGTMGALHARVLAQSAGCVFARVIEPDAAVGRGLAEAYDVEWSPDFDLLRGIDAVVIAAATQAHFELGVRVLELGKPVLVEKPLTADYARSAELVAAAAGYDLPLVCGFLERFNPAVLTAKQFVREVVQINAIRHSPFVPRVRTGVATDLLIHDVDLSILFTGQPPTAVKGSFGYFHEQSKTNRSEDSADATMSFPGGALATISASRVSQRKVRQLSIMELDRLIEIDLLRRDITIYRHVADAPAASDGVGYQQQTVIEIPSIQHSQEPLAAQLAHFLRLVAGGRGAPEIAAERARILPAHAVVEQATRSALDGRPGAAPPEPRTPPDAIGLAATSGPTTSRTGPVAAPAGPAGSGTGNGTDPVVDPTRADSI